MILDYCAFSLNQKLQSQNYERNIDDPRVERTKLHKLTDIITIAICAVICGADTWEDIEIFGDAKYEWFKQFLELENRIPSHHTFARVFARLNPQQFQECFLSWVKFIKKLTSGEIIAIDGKTLRHSYDSSNEKAAILKEVLGQPQIVYQTEFGGGFVEVIPLGIPEVQGVNIGESISAFFYVLAGFVLLFAALEPHLELAGEFVG